MWSIKILTGPLAGKVFPLKSGKNRLGRSAQCDIVVSSLGVSKEHAEIQVIKDKVVLVDMKSSNGTFLNNNRVHSSLIRIGDRIKLHNIAFELIGSQNALSLASSGGAPTSVGAIATSSRAGSSNPGLEPALEAQIVPVRNVWAQIQQYKEDVVLPGLYRLIEVFEFRMVFFGFMAVFILMITLLTVVPMKEITNESTHAESRRRALTVAHALAQANEKVIRAGDLSNMSVDFVMQEDGIDDVYIVSKEGTVIAPAERAGSHPPQTGFIKQVQGSTHEMAAEIGFDHVGAAYPIFSYDSELQQNVARAFAVVIFNSGSLQMDEGRTFSLFVQMLIIAFFVGLVVFYLLYEIIIYPWRSLNMELDTAMRERKDQVQSGTKLRVVQDFIVNINSLLVRAMNPVSVSQQENYVNHDREMLNLVELMGYPALILNQSGFILGANSSFQSLTNIQVGTLQGMSFTSIPDQALQKNIESLMGQVRGQLDQTASDAFEISGHQLRINCQAFLNSAGEISYYIIAMTPVHRSEGGAA